MVFHRSLSESNPPQVFRTLPSILAVFNNVVVEIVSTRLLTSKSSIPFSNPFVTVPKAPIKIGTIVTLMFHSFFQFSSQVVVLILLFTFFQFFLWSAGTGKSTISQILFILFILLCMVFSARLGDACVCQSPIGVSVSFSWTGAGLCIYHLFVSSNLNLLHISQWIALPNQSCLVMYSFCANLLHSLIMWLIVSSPSSHCLHLLYFECYLFSL